MGREAVSGDREQQRRDGKFGGDALYSPYSVLFARSSASSSVLNVLTITTGPKISSVARIEASPTSLMMVGSMKWPYQA